MWRGSDQHSEKVEKLSYNGTVTNEGERMSNIADIIVKAVSDEIKGRDAWTLTLEEENPLDPTTPAGVPLRVTGMGLNGAHISYSLPGWDQISKVDDDPYFIVTGHAVSHVVRRSITHTKLFNVESIIAAVEEAAYAIEDEVLCARGWD